MSAPAPTTARILAAGNIDDTRTTTRCGPRQQLPIQYELVAGLEHDGAAIRSGSRGVTTSRPSSVALRTSLKVSEAKKSLAPASLYSGIGTDHAAVHHTPIRRAHIFAEPSRPLHETTGHQPCPVEAFPQHSGQSFRATRL